jgi:hypothetical protein
VTTGTAGALVLYNLVTNRRPARDATYIARNAGAAAALLAAARRQGLTWEDVGLDRARVRSGALAERQPAGRALLSDRRAGLRGPELIQQCLVRIPVGTAAFEEFAFRGILYGMVAARHGNRVAIVASSVVFGLWHVGPTLAALRINGVRTAHLRSCAAAAVASAGAGVALGALRSKGGHLAAPWLVHWACNAAALIVAAAWQRHRT